MQLPSAPLLLVDDNAPFRGLMAAFLNKAGYKTLEAENGEQALALLDEHKPSMIFLDLQMQPMGGFDFMREYTERSHTAPVVLVTGDPSSDILTHATALGFAGVLKKPVNGERVVQFATRFSQQR